jgi:hypothetical protein
MKKFSFVAFVLFILAAATVAQDVRYNFAQDVDFSKFKTYKWVELKGSDQANAITQKQIVAAIDAELAKKGLQKTDSDNADLYIDTQTAVSTEKQFTSYNTGWGYGPGWGGRVVWRHGFHDDHRLDVDDLRGTAGSGHVRFRKKGPGVARRGEQDHRPQGETRKTAKKHYESGGKTSEELPTEEEIVTSGVRHEGTVGPK